MWGCRGGACLVLVLGFAKIIPAARRTAWTQASFDPPPGPGRASRIFATLALLAAPLLTISVSNARPAAADDSLPDIAGFAGDTYVEGDTAKFQIVHGKLSKPIRVNVTFSQHGSYVSASQLGRRTVTTVSNANRTQTTISIPTIDDNTHEADGSVTMTVNPGSGYTVVQGWASGTAVLTDNDDPRIDISDPSISVKAGSAIREGGTATFTLSANPRPASSFPVNVDIAQHGDFASEGQTGTRTVIIGANGRGTLSVATTDDGVDEDDGSITVTVLEGTGYSLGTRPSVTVEVTDGGTPTPRVSVAAASDIDEGGTAAFTLTADPAPAADLDLTVDVSATGDFGLSGEIGLREVTVGSSGVATLTVPTVYDAFGEPDGSVSVTVIAGSGYLVTSPSMATVAVRDLGTTKVNITPVGSGVIEGETAAFRLIADPPPVYGISVNLRADVVGDYVGGALRWETAVSIGPDGIGRWEVSTDDDDTDERAGSITATVLNGDHYNVGRTASASVRINDDDAAVGVRTVSVGDATIRENSRTELPRLRFPFTLSSPTDEWLFILYETRETPNAAHPATAGQDYRAHRGAVWFRPGETALTKHTSIRVYNDDEHEEAETMELVITKIIGPADIAAGTATGTIEPDPFDAPRATPVISLSVQPAVVEGQPFTFTLTATPPPEDDLPITVTVTDGYEGDSSYTSDFIIPAHEGSQTVTYLGEASLIDYTRQTFSVRTVDDRIDEADGPVFVEVEIPEDDRYISSLSYRGAVIVYDNDGAAPQMPVVSISDGDDGQGATEESGRAWFSVSLDRPVHPDGTVTVEYNVQSGTARPHTDFVPTYRTLTFAGGEDHKYVEIELVDDDIAERDENFIVRLWNPRGAALGDDVGHATILASDNTP